MMTSFVSFIYEGGEWQTVPPFEDGPTDAIKAGKASAGAIIFLTEVSGMAPAIEQLAAKLMEEVHQMRVDGTKLLGEEVDLEDEDNDGGRDEKRGG